MGAPRARHGDGRLLGRGRRGVHGVCAGGASAVPHGRLRGGGGPPGADHRRAALLPQGHLRLRPRRAPAVHGDRILCAGAGGLRGGIRTTGAHAVCASARGCVLSLHAQRLRSRGGHHHAAGRLVSAEGPEGWMRYGLEAPDALCECLTTHSLRLLKPPSVHRCVMHRIQSTSRPPCRNLIISFRASAAPVTQHRRRLTVTPTAHSLSHTH
mmetsp:Transcript_13240/g.44898  ORF Transcript_13240/g.44898 Transcript_13240/m.44898 type:complete len:211 (+) Transcript_13240:1632-2264(+)